MVVTLAHSIFYCVGHRPQLGALQYHRVIVISILWPCSIGDSPASMALRCYRPDDRLRFDLQRCHLLEVVAALLLLGPRFEVDSMTGSCYGCLVSFQSCPPLTTTTCGLHLGTELPPILVPHLCRGVPIKDPVGLDLVLFA